MTPPERTAYRVFKALMMARELHVFFTPTPDQVVWAREQTETDEQVTEVIRQLIAEGWEMSADDIAQLSPYITEHIARFGAYDSDVLRLRPKAFDPELTDVDFDALQQAA